MTRPLPQVKDLFFVLSDGFVAAPTIGYESLQSRGLAWTDSAVSQITVTDRGLQVAGLLPTEAEAVAGLLACVADVRCSWLRIVAARLKEAGQRRDIGELCQLIETLGLASREIREAMGDASLGPTAYSKLESELLGSGAEQPVNYPKLVRALGKTAEVMSKEIVTKPIRLKAVDPFEPNDSWCAGRVLQMPCVSAPHPRPLSSKRGEGREIIGGSLNEAGRGE